MQNNNILSVKNLYKLYGMEKSAAAKLKKSGTDKDEIFKKNRRNHSGLGRVYGHSNYITGCSIKRHNFYGGRDQISYCGNYRGWEFKGNCVEGSGAVIHVVNVKIVGGQRPPLCSKDYMWQTKRPRATLL